MTNQVTKIKVVWQAAAAVPRKVKKTKVEDQIEIYAL